MPVDTTITREQRGRIARGRSGDACLAEVAASNEREHKEVSEVEREVQKRFGRERRNVRNTGSSTGP